MSVLILFTIVVFPEPLPPVIPIKIGLSILNPFSISFFVLNNQVLLFCLFSSLPFVEDGELLVLLLPCRLLYFLFYNLYVRYLVQIFLHLLLQKIYFFVLL